MPRAIMRMNELRRERAEQVSFMPAMKTIVKHMSTMPPTTQIGMEMKAPPTLPKTPEGSMRRESGARYILVADHM
eukprot:6195095-Pleurochrysis_carterae.AAC.3